MIKIWMAKVRQVLRGRGAAAFLVAALVVGVLVGLAAALLVTLIDLVRDFVDPLENGRSGWSGLGRWAALVALPVGLMASYLIARRWGPGVESGGVTETMVGMSLHGGYLPTRTIGSKIAATAATLGTGGSAGREGPVVQIGATIGSSLARYTHFGEDQIRSLVAAGAGAGIGASFNAPIAGMLFAMEVILGNFAIRHLNAVVVASVAAAVTARTIVGEEEILSGPAHNLDAPAELLLYAALGLLAVAFGILFLRVLDRVEGREWSPRLPSWTRPLFFAVVVGLLIAIEPELLGTGQDFVGELLRLDAGSERVWWALLLIAAGKTLAAASTRAGGGSGGQFMPSLFIGSAIGGGFALLIEPAWGFSELDPGAFAVVGMAATFAAVARAPLTSIIIVFELTQDYGLVLPLMLATSLATVIADRLHPATGYTLPLVQRGVHLPRTEDIDLLDTVTVGEVMNWPGTTLRPDHTTSEAEALLQESHHHGVPVVTGERLEGVLTLSDISRAGGPSDTTTVGEAMTARPITAFPGMPVSAALARMAALDIGRLPVVADDDPTRFVGMFRRGSVVAAYHHALGGATARGLYRERHRIRTQPGASFFELPIPPLSAAHGARVRELNWPEEATLVSVRRGDRVIVPHGETRLEVGDTITAFGTGDARIEFAHLLEARHEPEESPL
jgi:CIC family chloride channel protein